MDGRPVMTDEHTRAVAALRAGPDAVPLVWDADALSWDMYRACVAACRRRGIKSPGDLLPRIIPEDDYREKWHEWCDRMQAEIKRSRAVIKPFTKRRIPDVLAFEQALRAEGARGAGKSTRNISKALLPASGTAAFPILFPF